jgi:tetratricopeptide (TPR) repeat protein
MAAPNWVTAISETVGILWGLLIKAGMLALGAIVGGVIIWEIVRQCLDDGILLETAIVKVPADATAPTAEMATQQIAVYIGKVQRTGPREWRTHEVSDGDRSSINLRIPGASVSVETVVREVAELFPQNRKVVKTQITPSPSGKGYTGTVVVSGRGASTHAVCPADAKEALDKMFECLAVEAMKAIEPLFAASYVLSAEQAKCAAFKHDRAATDDPVADDVELLQALRGHCSFKDTRALMSAIVERGEAEDQPWVPYIYGKLHLARADAVAAFDRTVQWDEFDRAIRRFEEIEHVDMPPSALEAHIKSALRIQETVLLSLNVKSDGYINHRVRSAETILDRAAQRLAKEADRRQRRAVERERTAAMLGTNAKPATVDEDRVDAMIAHLRGLAIYRKWMVKARLNDRKTSLSFAETDEEKQRVRDALLFFEAAEAKKIPSYWLFMDLGNALLALREFDRAIESYRRAGDIDPKEYAPLLNITIALLEKSKAGAPAESRKSHFEAMRHTSSYLTWVSDGGPFDNFVDKVKDGLMAGRSGKEAVAVFDACRDQYKRFEGSPELSHMTHTAALRLCLNMARRAPAERGLVEEAYAPRE